MRTASRLLRLPRRRPRLAGLLLSAAVLFPAAWLAVRGVDAGGRRLYTVGREVVEAAAAFAGAIEDENAAAIREILAADFSGPSLGLARPVLADEKNGVRGYHPAVRGGLLGRDAAVADWIGYRRGLRELESFELHLDRLASWSGDEIEATLRFEAIGTPGGETRPGVDRALLRATLVRGADGRLRFRTLAPIEAERLVASLPQFRDVAPAAGIDFVNRFYPPFLTEPLRFAMLRFGPAGIAAADVDGDGLVDLFVPDGVASRLFVNRGDGGFDDVTEAAGLAGLSGVSVALLADFDDDGDPDLFASRTFELNQLFVNRGDGTFEDVTATAGLSADCCTTVASAADYDLDGDLDLYLGRYLDPRTQVPTTFYTRNGEPNRLYRNDGGLRFTDVTDRAGVGEIGLCLGSVFGDYDDDGDPDLYVVNDFGRKTFYRNEGDGTFRDVTVASGTLAYGAGMSASFGDYDNDGLLDLYVAHIRSDHAWFAEAPTVARYLLHSFRDGVWRSDMPLYLEIFRQSGFAFVDAFQQMASGNTLLRNRGDGTFEDVTGQANANPPGWFWGSSFADFDNDGWQDLYSVNGWVYGERDTEIELDFLHNVVTEQDRYKTGEFFDPASFDRKSWHGWERNRHLRNQGDGTFREIGRAAGTDLLLNSRGIAVADFWNRGVLDVAVAASTDRHALLKNEIDAGRHWLTVELVGAGRDLPDGTNRDAVGARAVVEAGGLTQLREVVLGDGYGSQNDLRAHFGLGATSKVDRLTVVWPRSGRTQVFEDLEADRFLRVVEGSGLVEVPPLILAGPGAVPDPARGPAAR